MYPLPGNGQAGTYIFPQIFRPFGQNAIFSLLILFLILIQSGITKKVKTSCFSGWVDPTAIVLLEGLGRLKNPMTSSELEPATFRLVA
jgi:hypothetical protein